MKSLFIIGFLWIFLSVNAQTDIKYSSIDSGGNTATLGNTSIVQTIGEVAVQEQTQGNIHISEGFIHPDILNTTGIENYEILTGVQVYPNPATDYFYIGFEQTADYNIRLYNLNGKELLQLDNHESEVKIDISHLQRAVYLLIIIDKKSKRVKTYKIEKK